MSDRTLNELSNAEIVPNAGGSNAYMVRFGEGDYDTVNKSGKNTLLLKRRVTPDGTAEYGGIIVNFDLQNDVITLHDGDNDVHVPEAKHENVLWAIYEEDGPRLNKLFDELYTPTVREGLMDMLMPRFREEKSDIRKSEDGWLIGGDILVSWDATNHPVNVAQTHVVSGGSTVEADKDKGARDIQFKMANGDITLPNGTTTELTDVEMKFLISVGLILDKNPDHYDDGLFDAIESSHISAFTDEKSGLFHSHSVGKHRLSDLGVTDEATDRLWYNSFDHAGVHELALRENEFANAPIDVFEDAPNDDARKWEKINSTKEKAPIPKSVRSDLEERYGE